MTSPVLAAVAAGLAMAVAMPTIALAEDTAPLSPDQVREEKAYAAGVQVALWGRPFVDKVNTLSAGLKAGAVGLNYFRKFSNLKTATDKFVNTPNNVSIDAYAAADLTKEPLVVRVPTLTENRWYIVQTGMKEIKVPTELAVSANRIFVNGEVDLPAARAVQQGFQLLPLSVFQSQGPRFEVPKQYHYARFEFKPVAPESLQLFEKIGFGMKTFLSPSDDFADPDVGAAHQIGLSVANGFEWQKLDEPTKRGLARAAVAADAIIADTYANAAEIVNGWRYTMGGGRAGFNYPVRAAFSANLTGANVPEEILYPNTRVDDKGEPLSAANKYVLHFDKDKTPPVSVFWNMSMYDDKEFFIENDFKRYSIGSTTDGLKKNVDGSIDIYIQKDNPGADKQSNWLPAPAGSFNLTMRLYGAADTHPRRFLSPARRKARRLGRCLQWINRAVLRCPRYVRFAGNIRNAGLLLRALP